MNVPLSATGNKHKTDALTLERDLKEIGVSDDGAAHYAALFSTDIPFDFVLTPRNREYFKNGDIAGDAFQRLLPEINGRRLSSFFVEDIGHRMKCPDFISGKAVSFNADSVTVRWSKIPDDERNGFFDMIAETGAKRLNLQQTKITPQDETFVRFLNDNKIEEFAYSVTDDGMNGFLEKLNETKLKKLDLSYSDARETGLSLAFKRLPPTLESLVSDCNIISDGSTLDALCAGIRSLPLKNLTLQCCSLSNTSFDKLLKVLPPELETLNLGNNPNVTDKGAEALLKHMKRPDVLIRKLGFEGMIGVSKPLREELQEAAEDNNGRYMQKCQQQKADQIAKTKEGVRIKNAVETASRDDIKGLLHGALQHGAADAALERMRQTGATLTLTDVLQKNAEGQTLLEAYGEMGKLPQLMAPEMFGNVKDFKEVFDALSDKEKRIYDGREGRPSLQQVKNKIMSAAVKRTVMQKSGQRR